MSLFAIVFTLKSCQFRLGLTQLRLEIVGQGVVVLNPVLLGLHHSRLALRESQILLSLREFFWSITTKRVADTKKVW